MKVGAIDLNRPRAVRVNRPYLFLVALFLASCETTSTHQFAQPASTWQTRTGQLMYRNSKATVIGDVVIQSSVNGDFQLTFSKGPVALLTYRQDAQYAHISGAMVGHGWGGKIEEAPQNMRGWLGLRDAIAHSKDRHLVRHVEGSETFVFRF